MSTFKILIVDDDDFFIANLCDNLRTFSLVALTGRKYEAIEFTIAQTQQKADAAIEAQPLGGYDLILLDLDYPLDDSPQPDCPAEGDPERPPFQGMIWLPRLRNLQPDAALVILTAHPYAGELDNAVTAIRDHHANEFVPKTSAIIDIVARIKLACISVRRIRDLILLEEEYRALLRSHVTRSYSEDVGVLLQQASQMFASIARRLESGDTNTVTTAPSEIRACFKTLQREFHSLTEKLNVGKERSHEVNLCETIDQLLTLYRRRLEEADVDVQTSFPPDPIIVTTYESDFKVALHEVICNVLDSFEGAFSHQKKLSIVVERIGQDATVRISDNGRGFPKEVLKRLFEPMVSPRADGVHLGMGLHIASRMMHACGGSIEAYNRADGGAEVVLRVRDLEQ